MPKSELLSQILSDYLAADPSRPAYDAASATVFCDYAVEWLSRTPPIGVGHSVASLTLRFADGRELVLFDADENALPPPAPSMSITGTSGDRVRVGVQSARDLSLPITGQ